MGQLAQAVDKGLDQLRLVVIMEILHQVKGRALAKDRLQVEMLQLLARVKGRVLPLQEMEVQVGLVQEWAAVPAMLDQIMVKIKLQDRGLEKAVEMLKLVITDNLVLQVLAVVKAVVMLMQEMVGLLMQVGLVMAVALLKLQGVMLKGLEQGQDRVQLMLQLQLCP